jgi:uncharacterized protein YkwD
MKSWLTTLVVLLLTAAPALAQKAQQDASTMEQELLRLVNQERVGAGLPEFHLDPKLVDAARAHSALMAQHKKMAHDFDGEATLSQRIAATGLRFNAVAENVSAVWPLDQPDPAEVAHRGLMGSPPHRANILNRDYNQIGIGVAREGDTFYTTEDFAHAFPASTPADIEKQVAQAVNEVRRRQAKPPLRVITLDRLSALACDDKTNTHSLLASFSSARTAAVFTTWTPSDFPQQLRQLAVEDGLTAVSIHACAMPSERGGSGGFKVAALFF